MIHSVHQLLYPYDWSSYDYIIGAPRGRADGESDSVKDFYITLFAYLVPTKSRGNVLTGIQP